ncbi:MAG: hypothetical protein KBS83_05020 [Lachnospiraceae bacterium]|nr:hypothetical protein [Candidatus Equihabitans merdae]
MIISSEQLLFENRNLANAQAHVQAMVKKGVIISLKRGLFETDVNTPGFVLANSMLGPSYLSFEYALAYYGMIPERVCTYTSAVCGRNKTIEYENRFGVFTYRDVPENVFPYYYTRELFGERPYLIANREKALCDQLSTISPIRGIKDFREYLFDGMRLDEDIFEELDFTKIRRIAPMYHRTNLYQLVRLIDKEER